MELFVRFIRAGCRTRLSAAAVIGTVALRTGALNCAHGGCQDRNFGFLVFHGYHLLPCKYLRVQLAELWMKRALARLLVSGAEGFHKFHSATCRSQHSTSSVRIMNE